jgi:hypothetical protein
MGAPNALALAGRKGTPLSLVRQCQEMMSAVPPVGGQSVERNGHQRWSLQYWVVDVVKQVEVKNAID